MADGAADTAVVAWASVTKALESYKNVDVRAWVRELVIEEVAIDERLWRCHPLSELRMTVPRLGFAGLGGVGFLKNLVTLVVRDCGLMELPRSLSRCVWCAGGCAHVRRLHHTVG